MNLVKKTSVFFCHRAVILSLAFYFIGFIPIYGQLPDLTVSNVRAPAASQAGQFIAVYWTVSNIGTAGTGSGFFDGIYLSRDTVFDPAADLEISFYFHASPINTGASEPDSTVVPLPADSSGQFYIFVRADDFSSIAESNENNNFDRSHAITISTKAPDLVVSNLKVEARVASGSYLHYSYTVKNVGDTSITSTAWYDGIYLLTDSVFSDSSYIGLVVHSEQLAAGESLNVSDSVSISQATSRGRYFLGVKTNYLDIVHESNVNNNTAVSSSFQYSGKQPDLVVSALRLAGDVAAGGYVHYSYTVKNIGDTSVTSIVWSDGIFLLTDSVFSNSLTIGQVVHTEQLAIGESLHVSDSVSLPHYVTRGRYFVGVQTDYNNGVFETNETNNTAISASFEYANKAPDLVITNLSAPGNVAAGLPLHYSYTVKNRGDTSVTMPNWFDGIYLLTDSVFSTTSYLSSVMHTTQLAAGESLNVADSVSFPHIILPGRYHIGIMTDFGDYVVESEENNNTAISSSFRYAAEGPDLIVTQVQVPPTAFSGKELEVSWIVKNAGVYPTTAPSWYDVIYLSPSPTWDSAGSTRMASFENVSFLPAGQSYSNTQRIILPNGITGNYYIFVLTDQTNLVSETSDTNNRTRSTDSVAVALSPSPDLRVTVLTIPANAFSGDSVSVSYTITNKGNGTTAIARWSDKLFFSQDTVLDQRKAHLLNVNVRDSVLQPESSYTVPLRVKLPYATFGPSYFYVFTDADDQVYEYTAETNNIRRSNVLDITLTPPPDLVVTRVNSPRAGASGRFTEAGWTVQNQGQTAPYEVSWNDRVYVSHLSSFVPDSAIALGTFSHYGSLEVDSSYSRQDSVRLPDSLSGHYYVYVKTDWDDKVFEHTFKANNVARADSAFDVTLSPWADLAVISFSTPTTVSTGQRVTLSWGVQNIGLAAPTAPLWVDRIFISSRQTFDSAALLLKQVPLEVSLAPSAPYDQSIDVEMPVLHSDTVYLYVFADADNAIYEHGGEADNIRRSSAITVQPVPDADLAITGFTTPSTGMSSSPAQIGWAVTNVGTGATLVSRWNDAVYLSPDTIYRPSSSIFVTSLEHAERVEPGQSYTRQVNVPLPDGVSGTYYMIIVVDSAHRVNEQNYANNIRFSSVPVNISLTPSPDLRIASVTAPSNVITGSRTKILWNIENSVNAPTFDTTWSDAIYLSSNPILDIADIRLATTEHKGKVLGNGLYADSVEIIVPTYTVGDLYLLIATDSRKDIYEGAAGELNNVSVRPVSVTSAPPSDLYVTNIAAPDTVSSGVNAVVTWELHNASVNPASGWATDAVYISADSVWDVYDPLVGMLQHQINVPAGSMITVKIHADIANALIVDSTGTIIAPFPGVLPGKYFVIVRTDLRNAIPETDENNNTGISSKKTEVTVPALQLGVLVFGKLRKGESKFYRIDNVPADQALRVKLTSDNVGASHELYIKYGTVPTRGSFDIAFDAPFSPNQQVFVPDTRSGTYYVMMYGAAIPSDTSDYSIIAELVQFSVTSVSPNHGGNTGEVTVSVIGARFVPGSTVKLVGPDSSKPRLIQSWYKGSSQIDATFDLTTGAPLGAYSVVVTRPDTAKATLQNGFTVEPGTAFSADLGFVPPAAIVRGGSGFYAINIENTSNVDLPYLIAYIIIPGDQSFTVNTDRMTKISTSLPESLRSRYPASDAFDFDGWRFIPLIATHVRVGERLGIALQVNHVQGDEFPTQVMVDAYNRHDFIQGQLLALELYRQELLRNPNLKLDPAFLQLAQSPEDFIHTILREYVNLGFLTQEDISSITSSDVKLASIHAASIPKDQIRKRFALSLSCKDKINLGFLGFQVVKLGAQIYTGLIFAPVTMGTSLIMTAVGVAQVAIAAKDFMNGKGGLLSNLFCGKDPRTPTKIVASKDPNDLQGPGGYGDKRWVGVTQLLPYTIQFENDPRLATAPAQVVKITLPLDSTIDERSFRLGRFGFGSFIFSDAIDRSYYTGRLNLRDSLGIDVGLVAGVDVQTRSAFWIFSSIDTVTGISPINPLLGFLPVDDSTHRGEGFVTFSMRAKTTVSTGSRIHEKARIIFDVNDPLDTPPAFNTIDAGIPRSRVISVTRTSGVTNIEVRWQGTDDTTGSGIGRYTLFASTDDSAYTPWLSGVTDTIARFSKSPGHRYRLYTLAIDNAGNIEPGKSAAEGEITITGVEDLQTGLPREFSLSQNYPNPFNPNTTIRYELPNAAHVSLKVYDVLGREAVTLADELQNPGFKSVVFNASNLSSGVYFYRLVAGNHSAVRKLVLMK